MFTNNIIHNARDLALLILTLCHEIVRHSVGKQVSHNLQDLNTHPDYKQRPQTSPCPPTSSELVSPFHFHPGSVDELYQSPLPVVTFSSTTDRAIRPRTPVTCACVYMCLELLPHKENYEVKIEESEKAGSRWELTLDTLLV